MLNPPDQVEIMRNWQSDSSKPLVSIRCYAYNHEAYIEQALHGFLIQKTDFPFEIVIHDDASSDNTAKIIKRYQEQYPEIIKAVLQSENQHSQGRGVTKFVSPLCKGKYIAVCEGDDYWNDPDKLQIQVTFLEANPDYVISGHDACVVDEGGNCLKESKLPEKQKRDFSCEDLILGNAWILTMSRVYRNVVEDYAPERLMVKNGDKFFISLIGHYGKSKYHPEIKPATYRVHSKGVWSMVSAQERLDAQINTHFWMYRYYNRIGETRYAQHFWRKYLGYVFRRASSPELIRALFKRWLRWGWR